MELHHRPLVGRVGDWRAGLGRCLGRFVAERPQFYGIWKFSKNKQAAKDLLLFLSQKESARQLVAASIGCDLPSFKSFYDFETWKTVEPPVPTQNCELSTEIEEFPAVGRKMAVRRLCDWQRRPWPLC
jgi:hypothetical protein